MRSYEVIALVCLMVLHIAKYSDAQLDVFQTLLRGRSLSVDESKQVINLLHEIKSIVTQNDDVESTAKENKNDVSQIQQRMDQLSTHTSQKFDLILENISSLRLYASAQLKSLSSRIDNIEAQTIGIVGSQPPALIEDVQSDFDVAPINSYLLKNSFSASLSEDSHRIPYITTNDAEISDIQPFVDDRLVDIERNLSQITSHLIDQKLDIDYLNNMTETMKKTPATCECPVNNLQALLDFINDEMNSIQQSKASISRSEESISLLVEKVNLLESDKLRLSESVQDVINEINSIQSTESASSTLQNQVLSLKDQIESIGMILNTVIENNSVIIRNTTEKTVTSGLCVYPYKRAGDGSCLYVYSDKMLTWSNARQVCEDLQGDLAAPANYSEFKTFLAKQKLSRSYSFWIGGTDEAVDGEWKWVNGKSVDMGVQVWESGQPNQGKSANCMEIKPTVKFAASDQRCSLKRYLVCQQHQY